MRVLLFAPRPKLMKHIKRNPLLNPGLGSAPANDPASTSVQVGNSTITDEKARLRPLRIRPEWRKGLPRWMELPYLATGPGAWQVNRGADFNALPTWIVGPLYICAYVGIVWLSLLFSSAHFGIVPWGLERAYASPPF